MSTPTGATTATETTGRPAPPVLNDGFILAVEAALKEKVSGILVPDARSTEGGGAGRRVSVFYGLQTVQSERTPPYLRIDYLGHRRAAGREQRGTHPPIAYTPRGYTNPGGQGANLVTNSYPIPYDLLFQIQTFTRFVEQDRALMVALMSPDRIPPRFGWLQVYDSVRYFDLVDGPRVADRMVGEKREWRKVYTVRVSAEFFEEDLVSIPFPTKIIMDPIQY